MIITRKRRVSKRLSPSVVSYHTVDTSSGASVGIFEFSDGSIHVDVSIHGYTGETAMVINHDTFDSISTTLQGRNAVVNVTRFQAKAVK